MPQQLTVMAETPAERAQRKHRSFLRRSLAGTPITSSDGLFERACRWVLPWTIRTYPGLLRGIEQLLGGRAEQGAISGWRYDRRNMPDWAAAALADYLEARAAAALELVAELRAYHAPGRGGRRTGFTVVGPDGLDRRGNRARSRRKDSAAPSSDK